jgi:hypothetical protein
MSSTRCIDFMRRISPRSPARLRIGRRRYFPHPIRDRIRGYLYINNGTAYARRKYSRHFYRYDRYACTVLDFDFHGMHVRVVKPVACPGTRAAATAWSRSSRQHIVSPLHSSSQSDVASLAPTAVSVSGYCALRRLPLLGEIVVIGRQMLADGERGRGG